MRHFNGKIQISRWSIYLLLMILAAGSLYPFIFMFLTSLTQKKIMTASFDFSAMDLRNYKNLLSGFPILTYVKNSLIVVSCACFFNAGRICVCKKEVSIKRGYLLAVSGHTDDAGTGNFDSGLYNYEKFKYAEYIPIAFCGYTGCLWCISDAAVYGGNSR